MELKPILVERPGLPTELYRYQPLTAPDSIRLLVPNPSEDDAAPLHGSLLHATLADCDYELNDSPWRYTLI